MAEYVVMEDGCEMLVDGGWRWGCVSESGGGCLGMAGDAEVVPRPVRGTAGLAVSVGDDAEPDGVAG